MINSALGAIEALAVVILAAITFWYARSTARMAAHVTRQSDASARQAESAEQTIKFLRSQMEEQRASSWSIAQATIMGCHTTVVHWQNRNVHNLASTKRLPDKIRLVPDAASLAIEHARRIDHAVSRDLSHAIDSLRICESELDALRRTVGRPSHELEKQARLVVELLQEAEHATSEAQRHLNKHSRLFVRAQLGEQR